MGFVLFSPQRLYRAELAATWMPRQQLTGRGSHVAAMSAQGKTKEIVAGREDNGGERQREGAADLLILKNGFISSDLLSQRCSLPAMPAGSDLGKLGGQKPRL